MANTKITSRVIADNAVTTAAIADDAITSAKLDTNIAVAGTLTVTGDANFDTSTLVVDATNDRVGIGTTSPDMKLEIAGASGSSSTFKLSGRPDWTAGSGQYNVGNIYGENLGAGVNTTRIKLDGDDVSGTIQFFTATSGTLTSAMVIDNSQNITMSGTGAVKVPLGTTAQRPSSPTAGMVRYNTTLGEYESYVVNDWKILSSRDFTYSIDYLAVAGGGGGGSCSSANGSAGGGGAGGLLESSVTVTAGAVYTITVGSGGAGGSSAQRGANGVDSSISGSGINTITAIGGGGGGSSSSSGQQNGSDGGSGGGGGFQSSSGGSGTAGQGNAGGVQNSSGSPYGGAGGGGAGAAAANGHGTAGGAGSSSSITGASVTYAGGGGGGNEGAAAGAGGAGGGGDGGRNGNGSAGTTNTGGGGGGGGGISASNGGNGGSGVVILSIPTSQYSGTSTGSPTITTSGSNTILTFTQSGSYTA